MRLFGFEITRPRSAKPQLLSAVDSRGGGGWFDVIRESFPGAWQRNVVIDGQRDVLAFSAVFACVTRIAGDVAKMRVKLTVEDEGTGICDEIKTNSPFVPVLAKPNNYQNRINFWEYWMIAKLLNGNMYALKARDNRGGEHRGVVTRLYILDSQRVTPLVAESGDVYYQLSADHLAGLRENVTVPASEIIHDRMNCLWHPLVGVSPIYAAGAAATQGRRIQSNSTKFFDNMSRPSGMLSAPSVISDETAGRLKAHWEENFSGSNIGRVAVLGDGLKYEAMTIPAQEAQLIEQLKWTAEDVARCFGVPFFKIGGTVPPASTTEALNQIYYSDCLQTLIESAELCLDEGLNLPANYYTEFDLKALIRMDTAAQLDAYAKAVGGTIMVPNEARRELNLKPKPGGDSLYLQQQNYSLEALAKRDARPDPFATATAPKPESSESDEHEEDETDDIAAELVALGKSLPRLLAYQELGHG